MKSVLPIGVLLLITASGIAQQKSVDWQAHRGGRGLMPENTIAAMKNAIDLGVTTLELDVVISADKKVVVSHDPVFNEAITTTPSGDYLTKEESARRILYTMPYDSIKKYDVGLKPFPEFPQQKKIAAVKPLLSELLDSCEAYAKRKGISIAYNIEIKSNKATDNVRHPAPEEFTDLVMAVINSRKVNKRVTIQCFDVRPLQYLHNKKANVTLSYLVYMGADKLQDQLNALGFVPDIYSPLYKLVTKEMVDACHGKNMRVVPWTVNTKEEIRKLLNDGVDGVISDYPDLFSTL
ncbi:MAG: glycerophosphodiester phosphodiesterase family protein [Chitinophagaceae bacterium]